MVTEGRRYKILGAVGRGGFGTVYRAELTGEGGFSKVVALKVLNPDMEEVGEMAVRLRDEARVLGLLRHRAIVQVDGLVRLSGRWTVVMEYVEGADLKQVLAATGPFPATVALTVLEEVAGALHVAYTRVGPEGKPLQLLHRDIKPSNIQATAAGETKLLDFGVARAEFAGREAETRSLMFGSVGYMSPERLDFVDGPEGDVYALGAVLYELLSGVAFGKTSSNEQRHEAKLVAAVDGLFAAGLPEPLVELVAEMMAYDPAMRPVVRDVERRAARLRAELSGPTLRDWAEDHVSPVLRDRQDLPDDLSGCTLVEQGSMGEAPGNATFPAPRPAAPPRPPPGPSDSGFRTGSTARTAGTVAAVGGLGLLALGGLVAVVGVGAWLMLRSGGPEAPTRALAQTPPVAAAPAPVGVSEGSAAVVAAPGLAPEPGAAARAAPTPAFAGEPRAPSTHAAPAPAPPTPGATTAEPVPVPKPTATVAAATSPAAATAAPAARPTTPPASGGSSALVSVIGDARSVELVAGGKRYAVGSVPPGDYTVEAAFGEGAPVVAGKVQLVAGGAVELRCESVFARCRGR